MLGITLKRVPNFLFNIRSSVARMVGRTRKRRSDARVSSKTVVPSSCRSRSVIARWAKVKREIFFARLPRMRECAPGSFPRGGKLETKLQLIVEKSKGARDVRFKFTKIGERTFLFIWTARCSSGSRTPSQASKTTRNETNSKRMHG